MKVKDLSTEFYFDADSQFVLDINKQYNTDFGGIFYKLDETGTKYEELYGLNSNVPKLEYEVFKIK